MSTRTATRVAAEKAADNKAKVDDINQREESKERASRLTLARTEEKAIKAWKDGGEKGKRPATPNLDAIRKGYNDRQNGVTAPVKKEQTMARATHTSTDKPCEFYFGDKAMPPSRNRLPDLGWDCTAGIGGKGVKRIKAKEFRTMLVEQFNIENPDQPTWEVKLPNGNVVGCRVPGKAKPAANDKLPASLKAGADLVKAPAKKAAAKKATTKAPAKKAAQKQVTPRPKKAAAKKATAARTTRRTATRKSK